MPFKDPKVKEAWDRANNKRVNLKLNIRTDADIITVLESAPSQQRFIKEAIRYYVSHKCPPADKMSEEDILLAKMRFETSKLAK